MSEFDHTTPNDDDFIVGENLLYPEEDFSPAIELLSYVSSFSSDETRQFMDDFRAQATRGTYTLRGAYQNLQDPSFARRVPTEDFLPVNFTEKQFRLWGDITSGLTWANSVIQVDNIAGPEHESVTRAILHDPKSPNFVGKVVAEKTADLAAFRQEIDRQGGYAAAVLSIEKMQQELQAQIDWAYVVSSINALTGFGIYKAPLPDAQAVYVETAQEALKLYSIPEYGDRITHLERLKHVVATPLSRLKTGLSMPDNLIGHSKTILKKSSAVDGESRYIDRVRATAVRAVAEEKQQRIEEQKAQRAHELQQAYTQHASEAVPVISGKARKREGYEAFWNELIGRSNASEAVLLDKDAVHVLSTLHLIREVVTPSFEGVRKAQEWQQEVRVYEQSIVEEYDSLGYVKGLPTNQGVSARLDWLCNNWETVAGHMRGIPGFPVERVAAALFPEVAATIEQKEQKAEQRQASVAKRIGSDALEHLVVQEVDWEILPVEHIGERIQQEAQRMIRGKRADAGRRALQEVRVRDLIELSTLFDDAVVHVSREKEGITRRKNEPYFVITFAYGGQKFALAENLVLDNATFILPESEFSWRDVFSLPRGAVGEFGAQRINHPPVDEAGEYEGGPNTHVNAIFKKLDKALTTQ